MKTKLPNLANLLYELSNLDRVPRSGLYQFLYEDVESISQHTCKVAMIAYFMAKELDLDPGKVLLMAIFHDSMETRTSDSNWIQKQYVEQNEKKATEDQLQVLDEATQTEIKEAITNYKERKTPEAKVVKDADYIEYFMTLKTEEMKGNREATKRLQYETVNLDFLYTDLGKKLLKEVLKTDPNGWTRTDHHKTMKQYKKQVKTVRKKGKLE